MALPTQTPRLSWPGNTGEIRAAPGRIRAAREPWPQLCSMAGEIQEKPLLDVSVRYILAAIAFGLAALGFVLLPVGA